MNDGKGLRNVKLNHGIGFGEVLHLQEYVMDEDERKTEEKNITEQSASRKVCVCAA
jgi:hypothetical protein